MLYNWKTRRRYDSIRALVAAQAAPRTSAGKASGLEKVFLFGSAGLDEKALVRFRAHKSQSLACDLVPIGTWREWHDSNVDFDQLLSRACRYINSRNSNGPIRLAGHSQGGVMAYATAIALERMGIPVKCVVLFDTVENASGEHAFAQTGLTKGIIGPAKDWVVVRALGRNIASPRAGDPRYRILLTVNSLPYGPRLISAIAKAASVLVARRTSFKLESVIQRGRFQKMWFDWIKKGAPSKPLQAPVFLFRSHTPGSLDLGWSRHGINPTIVPVAGQHGTMLEPIYIEDFIAQFTEVMSAP